MITALSQFSGIKRTQFRMCQCTKRISKRKRKDKITQTQTTAYGKLQCIFLIRLVGERLSLRHVYVKFGNKMKS